MRTSKKNRQGNRKNRRNTCQKRGRYYESVVCRFSKRKCYIPDRVVYSLDLFFSKILGNLFSKIQLHIKKYSWSLIVFKKRNLTNVYLSNWFEYHFKLSKLQGMYFDIWILALVSFVERRVFLIYNHATNIFEKYQLWNSNDEILFQIVYS